MKMFFRNIFIAVEFLEIKISHAIFLLPPRRSSSAYVDCKKSVCVVYFQNEQRMVGFEQTLSDAHKK